MPYSGVSWIDAQKKWNVFLGSVWPPLTYYLYTASNKPSVSGNARPVHLHNLALQETEKYLHLTFISQIQFFPLDLI